MRIPIQCTIGANENSHPTRSLSAAQLESGGNDFAGGIGVGKGKWRLAVESDRPILVMSLLESPTGHVTNLSSVPD